MPRPSYNKYLDNFGIPENHPIWEHWAIEAAKAGRKSVKRYVLDLLLDRDAKLWGNGVEPEVGPQDLWFPGGAVLVNLADLQGLQTLLAGAASVSQPPPTSSLSFNEAEAQANAADWASAWDDE